MMTEKSISEFLSDEYKEFAMYVIEGRAIPSVIDGFKEKSYILLTKYGEPEMKKP